MKYLNYYQKDKALPQILEMLKKEGYNVTPKGVLNFHIIIFPPLV
jgi:hypothetical protein